MNNAKTWLFVLFLPAGTVFADGGVTFDNIAHDGVGLDYGRTRSPEFVTVRQFQDQSLVEPLTLGDRDFLPQMTGGLPGVAILDYDGDADLDIYVTNGPGSPNSLFQNQLSETGSLTFVDVAALARVAATAQDSAGVCYGDLDNDGDHDLVVLGRNDPNQLYENLGNATFSPVTTSSVEVGELWSSSCAVGDVDGDGLLDLFVANSADATDSRWNRLVPFALNEHNQLYLNNGGLAFTDVSASSGVEVLGGLSAGFEGSATITWAVALVDVDMDGDLDILIADDQAGLRPELIGGLDRGLIHVFLNDGSGVFTDHPIALNIFKTGAWMGLAFGDLDCDGSLDVYVSNLGDYAVGGRAPLGLLASRWFLGNGDGTFTDPGVGGLIATPFGWGTAIFDYDNDADQDIVVHGGLDDSLRVVADNPGAIHQNQVCSADFVIDFAAIPDDPTCLDSGGQPIPNCTEHIRRNVRGVAVGDLDRNGFNDVVSVANLLSPPPLPLVALPVLYGSVFDNTALEVRVFDQRPDFTFVWNGLNSAPGDLAVELSSDNGNNWVAVAVFGAINTLSDGQVNRDGIGAVISFTPEDGATVMSPVTGGSSHLSQHSLERIFGLGGEDEGDIDVLWPGGLRNRYEEAEAGERVIFPEIPCDPAGSWSDEEDFEDCVENALEELVDAGVLSEDATEGFEDGMEELFEEINREDDDDSDDDGD